MMGRLTPWSQKNVIGEGKMSSGFRIQGRVSEGQYNQYKELKKEYIKQTGEPVMDGQFIMVLLNEWAENQKKKKG